MPKPKLKPARKRTCKRYSVKLAEAVEQMLRCSDLERLDEKGETRAAMIRQILFDLQNEAQVFVDHRRLVKPFILACFEDGPDLNGHDWPSIDRLLCRIHELLDGYVTNPTLKKAFKETPCPESRVAELDREYNYDANDATDRPPIIRVIFSEDDMRRESDMKLVNLREKLEHLERLPENEAISLQLESEISRLERENANANEWPEVIGGDAQ